MPRVHGRNAFIQRRREYEGLPPGFGPYAQSRSAGEMILGNLGQSIQLYTLENKLIGRRRYFRREV